MSPDLRLARRVALRYAQERPPDPLAWLYEKPDISDDLLDQVFNWLLLLGDRRDRIGIDYNRFADCLNRRVRYTTPRSTFTPTEYNTFYDWFLRRMTPQTTVAARATATMEDLSSPVESKVAYTGVVGDGMIVLKEGPANVIEALRDLEPDISTHGFIKLSLDYHNYHHVHSPVGGKVAGVHLFGSDTDPFGHNNTTVIELDTLKGKVFVCCVGEVSVQSFQCKVAPGDVVRPVDELGWFWWGSQILVTFPPGIVPLVGKDVDLFIGDPLAVSMAGP